jgi:hypothetical protein
MPTRFRKGSPQFAACPYSGPCFPRGRRWYVGERISNQHGDFPRSMPGSGTRQSMKAGTRMPFYTSRFWFTHWRSAFCLLGAGASSGEIRCPIQSC